MTDTKESVEFRDRSSVEELGFSIQYHVCVIDPEISDGALRTYLVYLMHAHQKEHCWPLTSTVADIRDVDARTIKRHNDELENHGYITRQRRYGRASITYIENITKNKRLNELASLLLENRERKKNDSLSKGTKMSPSNGTKMSPSSGQKCPAEEVIIEEEPIKRISKADIFDVDDTKEEPVYVDTGDEFGDKEKAHKWEQPTNNRVLRDAFSATNKKKFLKEERSRWLAIEKAMMPLDKKGKVKYPTQWVEDCIQWADHGNRVYRAKTGSYGIKIAFPALLSLIENEERKRNWIARTLSEGKIELSDESPNTSIFEEEEDLGPNISIFSDEYEKV